MAGAIATVQCIRALQGIADIDGLSCLSMPLHVCPHKNVCRTGRRLAYWSRSCSYIIIFHFFLPWKINGSINLVRQNPRHMQGGSPKVHEASKQAS